MEDIEEVYTEGIEKEGEIFLEGIQNKKSLAVLEKQYSEKVKEIRRIYEKSFKKELNKEKEMPLINNNTKIQEKEEKEFRVKNLVLEKNWLEKEQIEVSSKTYKLKRKIKNILYKITPNYFIYFYYKSKVVIKEYYKETKEFFINILESIFKNILSALSYIKEGFIKVISEIKKVGYIFIRKSKNNKEGEKRDDTKKDPGKQTK